MANTSGSGVITDYILSNEDAMALLNVPSNSVAFYRYLAVKEVDLKANKTKVPYIMIYSRKLCIITDVWGKSAIA